MTSRHTPPTTFLTSLLVLSVVAGCAAADPAPSADVIASEGTTVEVERAPVLTEAGRLPENDPGFVDVDVEWERLVFTTDGGFADPLEAGDVVAGAGGPEGYLRRITAVRTLGDGRVEAMTEAAEIVDIIEDMRVIIHHVPPRDLGSTRDGEGDSDVGGTSEALGGVTTLIGSESFRCGGSGSVNVTPEFTIDPTLDVIIDVSIPRRFGIPTGLPKLNEFELRVGAEVGFGAEIRTVDAGEVACVLDVAALAGLPGIDLPPIFVSVFGFPIKISQSIEPLIEWELEASLPINDFTGYMGATAGLEVGVRYDDGWEAIWEPEGSVRSGLAATDAEDQGRISIGAELSAGLEYQARILGTAGPNFSLAGFIEKEVGTDTSFCNWESEVRAGLEASFGGEVSFDIDLPGPLPSFEKTLVEIVIAEVDLFSFSVEVDGGTFPFPWCDGCTSEITCTDALGREICLGGRGVLECGISTGSYRACTCTADGLVSCGDCTR